MRKICQSTQRLVADERGNFVIMAAVTFIPVLMSVAAAADISLFYRDRTAIQAAADAAALSAGKQFSAKATSEEIETLAKAVFGANTTTILRTSSVLKYEGTEWTPQGTRELRLSVCSTYDPIFLPALNISFPGVKGASCAKAESVVTVGSTTVEVALVLDTSGSMNDRPAAGNTPKISTLKTQATKAINSIFASANESGSDDPARVAIVPFSGGVNVGPSHLDDWWMDPKGMSPLHHENLDWGNYSQSLGSGSLVGGLAGAVGVKELAVPVIGTNMWISSLDPTKFMTRQLIYKALQKNTGNANLAYKGCVESRPTAEFALTDKPPSNSNPASLFVPFFAPDESDNYARNGWTNKYVTDSATSNDSSRLKGVNKYFAATKASDPMGSNYNNSPSFMCDSAPLMPLTNSKQTALNSIDKLVASGATNVPQGVEWGWKVLSKNEPFTEGRAAGDENNIKAMIVMTDGQNTYYNDPYTVNKVGTSTFGAYGYTGIHEPNLTVARLFDYKTGVSTATNTNNYTDAMNGRLAAICENAKADGRIKLKDGAGTQLSDERGPVTRDGILIYTIAFDIPAQYQNMVNGLLKGCASYKMTDLRNTKLSYSQKGKYFYSAANEKDLESAFNDIMASLTNLRIAR